MSASSNMDYKPLALYIHWPFCLKKCPYCDFNSHVRAQVDHHAWLTAYQLNLRKYKSILANSRVNSIFFGGGTPSLASGTVIAGIIQEIADLTTLSPQVEITLEANPTSVEAAKLAEFKAAGVNRISLGIQSLNSQDLAFLGREHSVAEALAAIKLTEKLFTNFSLDFIYALPDQRLSNWQAELAQIIALGSPHLSLYQLTIEQGTKFAQMHKKGELIPISSEEAALFYEKTQEKLEQHRMPAYEISNHALAGHESQHNLSYWRYQDYLGIGPGAHSRLSGNQISRLSDATLKSQLLTELQPNPAAISQPCAIKYNVASSNANFYEQQADQDWKMAFMATKTPESWRAQIETHGLAIADRELISSTQTLEEKILMGLRLSAGIELDDAEVAALNQDNLRDLISRGLVEFARNSEVKSTLADSYPSSPFMKSDQSHCKLRIPQAGRLIADAIIGELLESR